LVLRFFVCGVTAVFLALGAFRTARRYGLGIDLRSRFDLDVTGRRRFGGDVTVQQSTGVVLDPAHGERHANAGVAALGVRVAFGALLLCAGRLDGQIALHVQCICPCQHFGPCLVVRHSKGHCAAHGRAAVRAGARLGLGGHDVVSGGRQGDLVRSGQIRLTEEGRAGVVRADVQHKRQSKPQAGSAGILVRQGPTEIVGRGRRGEFYVTHVAVAVGRAILQDERGRLFQQGFRNAGRIVDRDRSGHPQVAPPGARCGGGIGAVSNLGDRVIGAAAGTGQLEGLVF